MGAGEHRGVSIGGEDADRQRREPVGEFGLPQDCDCVGLLAGRASRTPDVEAVRPAVDRSRGERGEHLTRDVLEHTSVAVEVRDRDRGQLVERCPLLGMSFEVCQVGGEVGRSELASAAASAAAHLATDLAKPGPAHAKPGQRPLQKRDAVRVVHRGLLRIVLPLSPDALGRSWAYGRSTWQAKS